MANTDEEKPKKKNWKRWALEIGVIVLAFALIQWWQTKPMASGQAPELQGWSTEGKGVSLAAHRGEPVLVYFWAEWCPICKAVHGSVESISEDHTVISVAMQSGDASAIRDYQRKQELSFPAIPDPYGEISTQWGVKGVPAAFIIGADGKVRHSAVGFTTEAGLRARLWSAQNL